MSDIAIAEPQRDRAAKRERIPPRIVKAVRLLISGECKTQKAAAERAGLNASYLCEVLSKPKIQAFIAKETRRTIQHGTMRASARLIELIDAESEHVSLDAAKHTLAIEGIRPPDNSQPLVNIAISPGYVVKLKHADDATQLIEHQSQDDAKALTDHTDIPHAKQTEP